MARKEKRYYAREMFAGEKQTNEQNSADGSMMMESNLGMANLPQGVIIKAYPNPYQYPDNRLMTNSDNMMGIDAQIGGDEAGARKHHSKTKY